MSAATSTLKLHNPITIPVRTRRRFDVVTRLFGRQQRCVLAGIDNNDHANAYTWVIHYLITCKINIRWFSWKEDKGYIEYITFRDYQIYQESIRSW